MQEEADLEEFYRDNHVRFYRYALRLTRHREVAADVVQEALVRCLPRFVSGDPQHRVERDRWRSYLFTAIHHQAVNVGLRGRELATDPARLGRELAADVAEAAVVRDAVQRCLDRLSEIERSAYLLALEGFRQREVAEMLTLSADAAYRRIRVAEGKLRRCFEGAADD